MTCTREEIDAEKARKSRPDLLPARALIRAGQAMGYGHRKHGDRTWVHAGTEQAEPQTHLASAMRHLLEHLHDPEALEEGSGLPVLWHAAAQVLIAIECVEQLSDAPGPERAPLPPTWRWAPEQTEPLPEGWRWVLDTIESRRPWGACPPRGGILWGRSPSECVRRAHHEKHGL